MNKAKPGPLQLFRGEEARLPILVSGEPAVTMDTKSIFVGTPDGNIRFPNESEIVRATIDEAKLGEDDYKIITPRTLEEAIIHKVAPDGAYRNIMYMTGYDTGEFKATVATNTFTIPSYSKDNVYILTFIGSIIHENINYTISTTGVVTLGWTLAVGESISFIIFQGGYYYNQLKGLPEVSTDPRDLGTTVLASAASVNKVYNMVKRVFGGDEPRDASFYEDCTVFEEYIIRRVCNIDSVNVLYLNADITSNPKLYGLLRDKLDADGVISIEQSGEIEFMVKIEFTNIPYTSAKVTVRTLSQCSEISTLIVYKGDQLRSSKFKV